MTAIDVIVVNYLTGAESVATASTVAGTDTTIWIVDNSGEVIAEPPDGAIVLGDGTNTYYAPASNLAYAAGGAEFVLLLNPDVTIEHDQLRELAEILDGRQELWGVAPRLLAVDDAAHYYLRRLPTTRSLLADLVPPLRRVFRGAYRAYYCSDVDPAVTRPIDQPAAGCLLVRRSAVGKTLFDERYRLFFNDTDLSRRMRRAGRDCLYVATIGVRHVGGVSIERERERTGTWVSEEYDRAAALYARENLRFGSAFALVARIRLIVRRIRRRSASAVRLRSTY